MASTGYDLVGFLMWLEKKVNFICPLKFVVQTLRLKASFLKVFLGCKAKWHLEDGNLKVLLTRLHTVFRRADLDLRRLWADTSQIFAVEPSAEMTEISSGRDECLLLNMDGILSSLLERLQLLQPDIQEAYAVVSKSSRSNLEINDEAGIENLNFLLENIKDLLACKAELVAPLKEELDAVERSLRFLRNFLGFTTKRCSKLDGEFKNLLSFAEALADEISCLLYLCSDKINNQMVNEMKIQLSSELTKISPALPDTRQLYIRVLRAPKTAQVNSNSVDKFDLGFLDCLHDHMLALSDTKLRSMSFIKNKILSLYNDLRFLTFFAMDLSYSLNEHTENDQIFKHLFERTSDVINEIGYVIFSFHNDEKNDEMATILELNKRVSDLRSIIMAAKEDTRKMYDLYVPKSLRSNFPNTNGHGFIGSLLEHLKELLSNKADLFAPLKSHIEMVQKELLSVREDLSSHCEELQSQWIHLVEAAYQTEYVIDSFVVGDDPIYYHKLGFFNIIEEIRTIKIELKAVKNKITDNNSIKPSFPSRISLDANSLKDSATMSSEESLAKEKSQLKVVIFEKEAEEVRERLTNGPEMLNIVSIVGMPGIGKTSLAESVFQHSSITNHFHVQARCTVSQVHDRKRLLREILQHVDAKSKEYKDDDLDQKLYQSLKGRRYLVFMDDIWDIQAWKEIRTSFPDDGKGSRILFTSRFDEIASQTGLESINYHLSPLSEGKSWKMLELKIFENKSCPPELERVAREIATNCKGLPLTIDLVAGILRVTETKEWKEVAKNMTKYLFDDPQGRCRKVLEFSYHNLPDEFRPCFLYYAAFSEDEDIPTRKLILLWIAEGFVQLQKDDQRSLEDAAENILDNLISRSLVMVSKRRRLGGVKASRVHDLLHEFALGKAQEESFMLKVIGNASDGHQWREPYRLSICPGRIDHLPNKACVSRARVLIQYSKSRYCLSSFPYKVTGFRLLRVLDIAKDYFDASPTILCRLIHLRFLAIRVIETQILSEVHNLQNLETFIMIGPYLNGFLFLDKICNMMKLRNLCFGRGSPVRCHIENISEKSLFDNLRTVYHLAVSCIDDAEQILKLMPNLVELKIHFYHAKKKDRIVELDFHTKLKSFHLETFGLGIFSTSIISYPPYLKELILSNFFLTLEDISEIGNLEYLEVFKMDNLVFPGPKWEMRDGEFSNLKYLSLKYLNIEEWNASEEHIPHLEVLHLKHCKRLKELPSCLEEISTLREIKVKDCSSSAGDSAMRIKEEQTELGNELSVADIRDNVH